MNRKLTSLALGFASLALSVTPALAAIDPFSKPRQLLTELREPMLALSGAAFVIALMIAGFKYFYQQQGLRDVVPYLIGAGLVLAAGQLGAYFLPTA